MSSPWRILIVGLVVAALFSIMSLSCKQYDYVSPTPGILEVRFRVLVNDPAKQRLIPFAAPDSLGGVRNSFLILLKSIIALRPDGSEQELYADLTAIRRNPDGDVLNCLDTRARDSVWDWGIAYFPPSSVSKLLLRAVPTPAIVTTVFDPTFGQFFFRIFDVRMPEPPPQELQEISTFGQGPLNIRVDEGKTTKVTLTFDLDSSLVRRTEWYEYHPKFYITSIQQF
jgi:hypothetical protein